MTPSFFALLGELHSRKLAESKVSTALPGLPDGHYVFAQYQTAFTKKVSAVEVAAEPAYRGVWHWVSASLDSYPPVRKHVPWVLTPRTT